MRFLSLFIFFVSLFSPYAHSIEKAEWTILHFASGKNDLDPFITDNINQMEFLGSSKQVQVIVQWGSKRHKTVQRLHVQKDFSPEIRSQILEILPYSTDMGDWKEVVRFVQWAAPRFPAKRYFLILSGHGNGWRNDGKGTIAPDHISKNAIRANQLSSLLHASAKALGQKIDLFGMDACLMSMAEIATEAYGSTKLMISSQEVAPGQGWPYDDFLKLLKSYPKAPLEQAARMLLDSYSKHVDPIEMTTISALDLDQMGKIAHVLKQFTAWVKTHPEPQKLRLAAKRALQNTYTFYQTDYRDVLDFFEKIPVKLDDSILRAVRYQIKNAILWNDASPYYQGSAKGLSIWLPSTKAEYLKYRASYQKLKFSRASDWNLFLDWVYQN